MNIVKNTNANANVVNLNIDDFFTVSYHISYLVPN